MTAGIARVTFVGGSLTLPVDTAYDRQLLVDHVLGHARRKHYLQVRVDDTTWLIEPANAQDPVVCSSCDRRVDRTLCRRHHASTAYCVACALAHAHLTIAFLSHLPAGTSLRDVQAHWAYDGEWVAWTRWPQATPTEIIDDMRLQRRFAPVLTWRCAEIRLPPASTGAAKLGTAHPRQESTKAA